MTVAELIEKLKEQPQDANVVYSDGTYGDFDIDQVEIYAGPSWKQVELKS